jgi:hypothetical protein
MFLMVCMVMAGCSTTPEKLGPQKEYCRKVCSDMGMKLFSAKEDYVCQCMEKREPSLMERSINR